MSHIKLIGDVTLGGNGSNNPVPLTIANYDLSSQEQAQRLTQWNVIVFHDQLTVNLNVTGLVKVNPATGKPMLDSTDPVYLPCPPFC